MRVGVLIVANQFLLKLESKAYRTGFVYVFLTMRDEQCGAS